MHLYELTTLSNPLSPLPPKIADGSADWIDYWTGSGDYGRSGYNSCNCCYVRYEMEEEGRL